MSDKDKQKLIKMIRKYGDLSHDLGMNFQDYDWEEETKKVNLCFEQLVEFINNIN